MAERTVEYYNSYSTFYISYKTLKSNNMPQEHFHDSYEFYYLMKGSRIFFIKDEMINVPAGSLIIIHPNVMHKAINTDQSYYERFIINFHPDSAPEEFRTKIKQGPFLNKEYIVLPFSDSELRQYNHFVQSILLEMEDQKTGYEYSLYGLFLQMLSFYFRCLETEHPMIPILKSPSYDRTTAVIKYINDHYSEKLTLENLSAKFYVSPHYLSRKFKKVTNFSLIDYINTVRVKEAIVLITVSDHKMATIAKKCGFSSFSNFSRVFKQITGHSPTYYKKRLPSAQRD